MNEQTSSVERELKLGVPSGFSLARLPGQLKNYVASPARFLRLHTVYYDTADYRLMRWGCSLRYRRGEGWTLKIPVLDSSSDTLSRTEHVFEGDLDRIPKAALELATAFLRGAPVKRVAELRTLRVKRDFRCEGSDIAEVVEDDVRVVDGTRVAQRFGQVEIELAQDADPDALDAIAAVLQNEGCGEPDPTPKNARAVESDGSPEIEVPSVEHGASIGDVVRAALGTPLRHFMHCDPLLRTSDDIEAVHKARVSIRKLRSHLHTFVPVLDEAWASDLRERLRWLQDALAPVRDADVFHQRMQALAERLPHADIERAKELIETLAARVKEQHDGLRKRVRDPHYVELLDDLVNSVREPRFAKDPDDDATQCMAQIMQRVFKKTRKQVRKAGKQPSDRALHRIRIKSKHLRYASEAFAGATSNSAARYAVRVESLQEMLGDQHDGVVALQRLRAFDGSPPARFAAGELAIMAAGAGSDASLRWRATWKKLARKRGRFW
ncbi:MAG: CHAD domain-containing protein [Candidatus Eremiobacteraeota bacterium]|nr:CHAD domain-containing protein [Candidatus Eremiobacteraeota bacterium]